ncbi:hypothetical protein [Sphingobacterium hotanense]|uniref:hypothetical protein n=1 Tax=Sphingobacterium hotanense TaxID=649196 RepID=UPI0011F3E630|nr:hypothetical protein [Sphingobacterium hotanense]
MAIQIIESISFATVRDVLEFEKIPDKGVNVTVREWKDLAIHPASGDLSFNTKSDASGILYNIGIQARLKNNNPVGDECIFKIKLCAGKELIVGSPFIPVTILQNSSLSLTSIRIDHISPTPPLELITN